MAGSVVQNVVVNVQREKKKKNTRRRRTGKKIAPRGNNPLAYSGASSTHEFRIPTHSLQTNAALLMPARTLDDVRAGGDNLLGYTQRPPMPQLAAKTDGLLERIGQLEGNVKVGMHHAGKTFEHFDARLKTLQEHVGKSNLSEQRPIPRPNEPEPEAPVAPVAAPEAPVAPKAAPAPEDAPAPAPTPKPKRPPFAPFKPTKFKGRTKEGTVKDKLRKQLMTLERAEYDSKRAAYERE